MTYGMIYPSLIIFSKHIHTYLLCCCFFKMYYSFFFAHDIWISLATILSLIYKIPLIPTTPLSIYILTYYFSFSLALSCKKYHSYIFVMIYVCLKLHICVSFFTLNTCMRWNVINEWNKNWETICVCETRKTPVATISNIYTFIPSYQRGTRDQKMSVRETLKWTSLVIVSPPKL